MASTISQIDDLLEEIASYEFYGKKIYLLGTSEFGPTNQPTLINSTVELMSKFGYGTLADAWNKIKHTYINNEVYLVKTTGEHSRISININVCDNNIIREGFTFVSTQSNEIFNEIEIHITDKSITIINPEELGLKNYEYKYSEYPTIHELSEAINKSNNNVYTHYSVDSLLRTDVAFYVCNPGIVYLEGGYCGLQYTKNMLYNCLQKTYEILESEDIDIIVPVDAFIDDIYPNDQYSLEELYNKKYYQRQRDFLTVDGYGKQLTYLNQLINFCIRQNLFGIITIGIMGFNSCYEYFNNYYNESNDIRLSYINCLKYNLRYCENPDYQFLVSIVGGDVKYSRRDIDNGYLAYAALCSNISFVKGTTNLPLDTITIYQEPSEEVLSELSDNGIIMFRHSPYYDCPVVYNGITLQDKNSDLSLYVNVRMIQLAISYLNKLYQYYIGNPISEIKQRIIADSNKLLNILKDAGIINKYKVQTEIKNYHIIVYLTLENNYMIKPLTVASTVNIKYSEVNP